MMRNDTKNKNINSKKEKLALCGFDGKTSTKVGAQVEIKLIFSTFSNATYTLIFFTKIKYLFFLELFKICVWPDFFLK
jgi:hypothetical protein